MKRVAALCVAAVLALLVAAGCGGADDEGPAAETTRVLVYLLRGEQVGAAARVVPETDEIARAAVEQLLEGPDEEETAGGLGTSIPAGTRLLDVAIANSVATVDLSGEFDDGGGSASMFTRLAQVVFTLTQFPTVEGVRLRLDGEDVETFSSEGIGLDGPQERADYEDQSPAILVETPALGDAVSSPFRLGGTANTFEANFQWELLAADGTKLAFDFVTATCGTGCRGTFDVRVTFDAGAGDAVTLVVWEPSAEDGSRTKEVRIPLAVAG